MTDTLRYRVCPDRNLRWVIRDCLANREVLKRGWTNCFEAQDIADALNAAFSAGVVHAGVDAALLKACEDLLPHVKDMVQRGSVPGEDTSHYSDARAVRGAEAVITAAKARAAHLDKLSRMRAQVASPSTGTPDTTPA